MADPKSTFRIRFGGSANSTIGSETRIYTDLVAHANSYANNFSANNLTISNANNILVSGNTLPDYIVSVAGEAGTGGGGTTVLVETESVPFNYNSNTTAKANGAVVNFIFEEHPGKTGEVLTNPFTITVSSNNLILDPEGSFLSVGDTITFLSVIANLRLISNGTYWYLSGDNTLTTVAVSNNYLQTQLGGGGDVSNNYLTGAFTSNNYLQSQGYGTGDVSNNYLQAQGYLTSETGDVSNNYIQSRFTSNTFVIQTYTSNNYLQAQGYGTGDVSNNYLQSQLGGSYRSGEIIEVLTGPCVGQNITVESGTYTMPNVTTTLLGTSAYQDITGSAITYTPPTGTTRVMYQFDFLIGLNQNIDRLLNHYKLYIDGADVTKYRHSETRGQYAADGMQTIKWTFEIGTANTEIGSQATWTTGKEIKAQFREYSGSYDTKLHETFYWEGTGSSQLHVPTLTITAIA